MKRRLLLAPLATLLVAGDELALCAPLTGGRFVNRTALWHNQSARQGFRPNSG